MSCSADTTRPGIAVLLATLTLLASTLSGCTKDDAAPARQGVAVSNPDQAPAIRVHPDEAHVYRYFLDGESKAKVATKLDSVPESARASVLVIPDADVPAGLVYVADLRKPADDGSFPYAVTAAADFERSLAATRPDPEPAAARPAGNAAPSLAGQPSPSPAAKSEGVIMFSTTWCGVCGQAKRWFRNKGIPYEELDVEKTPGARQKMHTLAKQSGFPTNQLNGVPVIWVGGKMLSGFNPRAIENLL
ncbi:MAG: glutaredoxin [Myxococcota bacterium]|jgi:glutaredoxin